MTRGRGGSEAEVSVNRLRLGTRKTGLSPPVFLY